MKTIVSFLAGVIFGGVLFLPLVGISKDRYEKLKIYSQVFNLVEDHYVDKLDIDKLVVGSIRGLLGSLDPYSGYLSRRNYKKFKDETSGEFSGLGIELMLKKGFLMIVGVIEDSPAWRAGVLPEDRIISVNGELVKGLDFTQATRSLKGDIGKKIKLTLKRSGVEKLITLEMKKERLKLRSVRKVVNKDGKLVVRLSSFLESSTEELKKILKEEQFKTLLIDIRHNPGGLLEEAISIVDIFVESGLILRTVSRSGLPDEVLAQKESTLFPKKKLFILMDRSSASAAEIVASSLKDLGRAKLLGEKTFGKGSVQSVIPLPKKKGGVKLTVARYFTASGKMIDGKGVKPDYMYPKFVKNKKPTKSLAEDQALRWALEQI